MFSCAVAQFLSNLSHHVGVVVKFAILKDILCRDYYATTAVNAVFSSLERCKVDAVQTEIALLNGWRETSKTIRSKPIPLSKLISS